jgi:hypothetical protein
MLDQLPLTELKGLEEMLEIKIGNGHHYTGSMQTNIEMVELHVDSHPSFHENMNDTHFWGNLSVRMPPNTKPDMFWTG